MKRLIDWMDRHLVAIAAVIVGFVAWAVLSDALDMRRFYARARLERLNQNAAENSDLLRVAPAPRCDPTGDVDLGVDFRLRCWDEYGAPAGGFECRAVSDPAVPQKAGGANGEP